MDKLSKSQAESNILSGFVSRFVELANRVEKDILELGELAATAVIEIPDFAKLVHEQCPQIPTYFVHRMVAIGQRRLHAAFLMDESPGAKAIKKLPFSVQEEYAEKKVPVLSCDGSTLFFKVQELTKDQAAQVFEREGVRDAGAQRAWIEDRNAKKVEPPKIQDCPWRLVKGEIQVLAPCTLKASDLLKMMTRVTEGK